MFIATGKQKKDIRVISVSFRDTKEEQEIYNIICKHSSKGGFIKDILKDVLLNKKEQI